MKRLYIFTICALMLGLFGLMTSCEQRTERKEEKQTTITKTRPAGAQHNMAAPNATEEKKLPEPASAQEPASAPEPAR